MINILSGIILFIFLLSYYIKLLMQSRENIDAFKLGKGEKESKRVEELAQVGTAIWAVTWFIEVLYSAKISVYMKNFFDNEILKYIGVAICLFGVIIF